MQTTHHKLLVFILLSVAIHSLWLIRNQTAIRFNSQDAYPLSVQINAPEQPSLVNKPRPVTDPPASQIRPRLVRADNGSLPATDKQATSDNSGSSTHHAQSDAVPVPSPEIKTNKASGSTLSHTTHAHIVAHINELIAHHFSYPLLARRRGWEGTVLLDFHLSADGGIHNIKVGRSSGHGILDRSAVTTLRKIGYLKAASPWSGPMGIDIQLPVIYRLQGG